MADRTAKGAVSKRNVRQERSTMKQRAKESLFPWPYGRINLAIFLGGIGVILLGYILLGSEPWDSTASLSLAPILLTLGYMVIIPFSLVYKGSPSKPGSGGKETIQPAGKEKGD